MWYDPTRNRYFRITQEHARPAPEPPIAPAPKLLKHPSVHCLLRDAELGRGAINTGRLPSALLAGAKLRCPRLSQHVRVPPPGQTSCRGAIAVSRDRGSVGLYAFPDGACLDMFKVGLGRTVHALDWCESRGLLAASLKSWESSWYPLPTHYCVLVSFGKGLQQHERILDVATSGEPLAVSCEQGGMVVGYTGKTTLYMAHGYVFTVTIQHPDGSAGVAVKYNGDGDVFTGTRAGNVYRWDCRSGSISPVWVGRPPSGQASVADLKLSADGLRAYISRMRAKRRNLASWDLRMSGRPSKPIVSYDEHVNSHKQLRFALDENVPDGMLVAGGDDCIVRAWNASQGGRPVWSRKIPGKLARDVKLVGWENHPSDLRPGCWIHTDEGPYVMEVAT